MPLSQEASTIPPNTYIPHKFSSLLCAENDIHYKHTGGTGCRPYDRDESRSIVQPNALPLQKSPGTAFPGLAEQVDVFQDLGEKLFLM